MFPALALELVQVLGGLILVFCIVLLARGRKRLWVIARVRWVGPLFWYDLARLARRNRTILLRFVYGLLLLAWLYLIFADRFPGYVHLSQLWQPGPRLSPRDMADFALTMVGAVVAVQGVAVFVITPAYLANAIAEEKERHTLELLFTTPLLDREIILGKMFGRLAHMGMILLTGMPILAMVRLWGGVDGGVLIAGFIITGLTLLSVGSVSMLCSVLAPNVLAAVVSSYAAVALLAVFTVGCPSGSPLTFLAEFQRQASEQVSATAAATGSAVVKRLLPPNSLTLLLVMLLPPAAFHLLIFALCTAMSVASLRGPSPDKIHAGPPVLSRRRIAEDSWGPFDEPDIYIGRAPRVIDYRTRVPVCDPPLFWKEVYHGGLASPGPIVPRLKAGQWWSVLAFMLFCSALSILVHHRGGEEIAEVVNGLNVLIRIASIACAGIWCVWLGFRVAVSVCQERQQKTLEGLFLMPVERKDILWAKWFGSMLRIRLFAVALLVTWAIGLISGALHPWAVLLLAGSCAVYLAFLASVGICLSLMNRNMLWANLSMALVILLLVTSSMLVEIRYRYATALFGDDWIRSLLGTAFNPVRTWWICGFSWQQLTDSIQKEDPVFWPALGSSVFGLAILALLAWLLWRLACIRFSRELERSGR